MDNNKIITDGLRTLLLAGVGAAALTVDKSQEILKDLVDRGELTVEQGKALNQELKHKIRETKEVSEEKKAEIWIQEVFDLFAAENLTRQNGESLIAFTRRIDRTGPFSTSAEPVGKIVSVLRYSAMQPGQEDTDFIRDTAVLLKSELSRPGHFRYWIRRVFLPASRRNWSR